MFSESFYNRPRLPIPSPDRVRLKFLSHLWNGENGRYGKFIVHEEFEAFSSEFLKHDPWSESANYDVTRLLDQGIDCGVRSSNDVSVYPLEIVLNNHQATKFILKPVEDRVHMNRKEQCQLMIENPYFYGIEVPSDNEDLATRNEIEEEAFRLIHCNIARQSLINQLYIGLQIEKAYFEKYGSHIKTEYPVGAYINNHGQKFAIYRFYEQMVHNDQLDIERIDHEHAQLNRDIDKKIETIGFYCADTQSLLLDQSMPIDISNIVLIDLEQAIKIK